MRYFLWSAFLVMGLRLDDGDTKYEGLTAEEWIAKWDSTQGSSDRDHATSALVKIGADAVPALLEYVDRKGPSLSYAATALCRIGEPADAAIDALLEIALDQAYENPEGWKEHWSARGFVIDALKDAAWASDRIVPVLEEIVFDASENDDIRNASTSSLGSMGEPSLPALRKLLEERGHPSQRRVTAILAVAKMGEPSIPLLESISNTPEDEQQKLAIDLLADVLDKTKKKSKAEFYRERINRDLLNPEVPNYIVQAKHAFNLQKRDELTEQVKEQAARRFAETHDAAYAHLWANILQTQLLGTNLLVGMGMEAWGRENPSVSFETLREVLDQGFHAAKKGSGLWRTLGTALAKLHLLRGEWTEMNAALAAMGDATIDAALRPKLCAPPMDWSDVAASWRECAPELRSGTSAFEVQVEKVSKGLKGVHVLLKKAKPQSSLRMTGIDTDTMCLSIAALETGGTILPSFGYPAENRLETRYGVTDESGCLRLEKLPAGDMELEILVPTANFRESGWKWELWKQKSDGTLERLGYGGDGRITLQAGETYTYPKLFVRPMGGFNVQNFDAVDADTFLLSWSELDSSSGEGLHQELELALAMPSASEDNPDYFKTIRSASVKVYGNEWPVGAQGVGDVRLIPGNYYTLQLIVLDAAGTPLARHGRIAVYVPWSHRTSNAPHRGSLHEPDSWNLPPFEGAMWDRGSYGYGDGRVESLQEKAARFVREHSTDYEYEYVSVIKAWLDWRGGDAKVAREQLARIASPLPEGNVARETALRLIRAIDAGEASPRPLCFGDDKAQVRR